MKKKGFTLIEVLLAVGLLAVVLGSASTIFYSMLKSARKTTSIAQAKSEGAYALRATSEMIKFSGRLTCTAYNSWINSISVTRTNLTADVIAYSLSGSGIASVSASTGTQNLLSTNVSVTACTGNAGIFYCESNPSIQTVKICFVVNKVNGIDVTDFVGATATAGVTFQTQVGVNNFGN